VVPLTDEAKHLGISDAVLDADLARPRFHAPLLQLLDGLGVVQAVEFWNLQASGVKPLSDGTGDGRRTVNVAVGKKGFSYDVGLLRGSGLGLRLAWSSVDEAAGAERSPA
jgi:hypothetical protein